MSRWHREHPEKGNQVEPDSSAYSYMQADAMRKGELPRPDGLCPAHPDQHARARSCAYVAAWRVNLSVAEGQAARVATPCPACAGLAYQAENDKAYDRKARLAEHAEELVWLVQRADTIRRNADSGAWKPAEVRRSWQDWTERAAVAMDKIETPEEGNKP